MPPEGHQRQLKKATENSEIPDAVLPSEQRQARPRVRPKTDVRYRNGIEENER